MRQKTYSFTLDRNVSKREKELCYRLTNFLSVVLSTEEVSVELKLSASKKAIQVELSHLPA